MRTRNKSARNLPLQSLGEECVKAAIYSALTAYAVQSAIGSESTVSLLVNLFVAVCGVRALALELTFLLFQRPKLPPGSMGFPLFGDLPVLAIRYKGALFQLLYEKGQLYGSIFISSVLGRNVVTLGDTASLTWLWNNDRKSLTESAWPPNVAKLLGPAAVANLQGHHHKIVRRLMEPFYTPLFVSNYLEIMTKTTDEDLHEWSQAEGFLSGKVFKLYALRLFLVSSFGEIDHDLITALHENYTIWIGGFLSLLGTNRFPGSNFDKAMKARDRILMSIDELMKKFVVENPEDSDLAKKTIMGRMIYAKDENGLGLSDNEIKDNLLNLIFAGHDTTFISINTVLHHLSQHPHVEAALVEEVSKFKEPLDLEEIKNAPVLNAVMHESWRVDPPAPFAFRKAVKTGLDYDGYHFPKGTIFSYNIGLAAHQEHVYPSANSFHMERFLPSDHYLANPQWKSQVDPSNGRADYPVFGGGTHVCLGKNFAKLELRIIMARMFKNYTVRVRNNTKVYMPVNGWTIDFQLIKKQK
jgi:cytochrome P450